MVYVNKMKKLILVFLFLYSNFLLADAKQKEAKIAKYVMENIQKDYMSCYSFYRVAVEGFKRAKKDKSLIDGLEKVMRL